MSLKEGDFEELSEFDLSRVLSKAESTDSSSVSLFNSKSLFDGDSSDGSKKNQSEIIRARLNVEEIPSSLKFASRNYMFKEEYTAARYTAREGDKRLRSRYKRVHFAELATFYCYDSDKKPYDDIRAWLRYCAVYLLTGHFFQHFTNEFLADVSQSVLSDPSSAVRYWKKIMLRGKRQLFAMGNVDGALNHVSILTKDRAGVLPLLADVKEELKEAMIIKEKSRRIKSFKSIGKSISMTKLRLYGDDSSKKIQRQKSMDSFQSEEEDPSDNIYINLLRRQRLSYDERLRKKAEADSLAIYTLKNQFDAGFLFLYQTKVGKKSEFKTREYEDYQRFQAIANIICKKENNNLQSDIDLFIHKHYGKFIIRAITLKNYIAAFSEGKLLKHFRKAFGSPALNPIDEDYESTNYTNAMDCLQDMLKTMRKVCDMIQEYENIFKVGHVHFNQTIFDDQGISETCEWTNFGKVVIYSPGSLVCKDFFTGSVLGVVKPENILTSELEVQKLLSQGKKIKKRKQILKKLGIRLPRRGDRLPPPEYYVPQHFAKMHEMFISPMKYWNFLKTRWTEQYLSVINTGIVVAALNDNLNLLRFVEQIEYPPVIYETSLLAAEPSFATGHSRNKESQRTSNVYKVTRNVPLTGGDVPLLPEYHLRYGYISSNEKEDKNSLQVKSAKNAITVDSLSVLLNPIVRADLYFSRIRHASDYTISGNSGMLLATVIRLGAHKVFDHLVASGLGINRGVSLGEALTMRWELLPDARKREKKKKAAEKPGRLIASQKSMNFIASARHLIAPQKSLRRIVVPENEDAREELEQKEDPTIYADELSLKENSYRDRKFEEGDSEGESESEAEAEEDSKKVKRSSGISRISSSATFASAPNSSTSKSKEVFDDIQVTIDKKISLISTFQKQTLLSIAIECITDDIYESKRVMSQRHFRQLRKREQRSLESVTGFVCKDIDRRYDLVERMLQDGARVLDENGAAVRACLPVIKIIAANQVRERKLNAKILANSSNINNMTMTPRDLKNLRKRDKKSKFKRFSVVEFLHRPKQLPSSTEFIASQTLEAESMRDYYKRSKIPTFEKKRRYTAAIASLRALNLVTQKAIKEITSVRKKLGKNRQSGFYSTIMIRVFLVHEAVKQEAWQAIRFLCPATVDYSKSAEAEKEDTESAVYENAYKTITPETAEVLKQTIKLLIKDMKTRQSTTTARAWNGIYFILREYNVTLSRVALNGLFACLGLCFTRDLNLKAGDSSSIVKFLTLRQVKAFLGVTRCAFYDDRILENYAISKSKNGQMLFKKLRGLLHKHIDETTIRQYLFIYATAENMTSVTNYLKPGFVETADKKILGELITHCITKKECSGFIPLLEQICGECAVDGKVQKRLFQHVLEDCMQPGKYDQISPVHARLVLELLEQKYRPRTVDDCFRFLCRLLCYPIIEPDSTYRPNTLCADLSVYFLFKYFSDLIFLNRKFIRDDAERVKLVEATLNQLMMLKGSELFYQGIEEFLEQTMGLYEEVNREPQLEPIRKMRRLLRKKMKWSMEYDFDKKVLRIHNQKLY